MCAVGRCLDFKNLDVDATNMKGSVDQELLQSMRKEYVGHSLQFWRDLQNLHDIHSYWNSQGLTTLGNQRLEELKELWKE